jgi:hypothetical protein
MFGALVDELSLAPFRPKFCDSLSSHIRSIKYNLIIKLMKWIDKNRKRNH